MKTVRIGCHAAFWGDSNRHAAQLVRRADVDYLISDYLAEITMSLLVRARLKDPAAGYASDFVKSIGPLLPEIRARGCRLVTNAGGIHPHGLRTALEAVAAQHGLRLQIAVVEGDDLMASRTEIAVAAPTEMSSGAPFPAEPMSLNAYCGAWAIASALDAGADIVVCGRCADSALALGPLIHEFRWGPEDYDRLAAGSLAGHVLECGTQATGGIFTDWQDVPGWEDMGVPIAEVAPDGDFVVTKPEGTGGLVTPAAVAEQILYEIGDPAAYVLPDVVCDFREVRLVIDGPDRVRVSGARGAPPTPYLKVGATYLDGYRLVATLMIAGGDAAARARRTGEAILTRVRGVLVEMGRPGFSETSIEVIGAEDSYGAASRARDAREVVLKIGARHPERAALEVLAAEIAPAAVSMAQGITGLFGGRPMPQPVVRFFGFLYDRRRVPQTVTLGDRHWMVVPSPGVPSYPCVEASSTSPQSPPQSDPVTVPLRRLAVGRSGDKGDYANIGIIARHPEYWPVIGAALTADRVANVFAHYLRGAVRRYPLPGLRAYNFVLERVLGGGGTASLRYDPQGKTYAQILLDEPVEVPSALLATPPREP